MSEWKKVRLGEICMSVSDGDHLPPPKSDSGVPFVTISDIRNNTFDLSNTRFVPKAYFDTIDEKRRIRKGDVLYSVVGSYGIPVYADKDLDIAFQRHIAILKPGKEVVSRYLYYSLLNPAFYNAADNVAIGAAQKTITLSALRNLKISLPPLATQRRIASILSNYDSAIANCRRQIALLEETAMRLYKEWFVTRVKTTWETVLLNDVIERLGTGLNPRKNFVLGKGNNYYVTIKNMSDNRVYLDSKCDKIDDDAIRKINRRSDLRKGDVLFSGIGTIGRTYLIPDTPRNWNTSESVFNLRANSRISPEYLYLLMLSQEMQGYAVNNSTGSAQKGIRAAALRQFEFKLPPRNLLQSFTAVIRPILKSVEILNGNIDKMTEARDRLLPKLMKGEIAV